MLRLPRFEYLRPRNVREAVSMMADAGPSGMFAAGGTDLWPGMKRRQFEPKTVVALAHLKELRRKRGTPASGLVLGAGMTLTEVCGDRGIRRAYPGLAAAVESISTPVLRNMGTIGGNLLLDTRCNYYNQTYEWRRGINFCMKKDGKICWVAPSSPRCWAVQSADSVPVLIAMGATATLVSKDGEREVPVAGLYNDDGIQYLKKRPDELLTAIRLPAVNGWKATYQKLRRRGAFDFPVVSVGACLKFEGATVSSAKIILGAVGSHPIEAVDAQKAVVGRPLDDATIAAAAEAAFRPAKPLDNTDFHLSWRKEMVREYVKRALNDLR